MVMLEIKNRTIGEATLQQCMGLHWKSRYYDFQRTPMTPSSKEGIKARFTDEVGKLRASDALLSAHHDYLDFLESILDKSNILGIQKSICNMQDVPTYYAPIVKNIPENKLRMMASAQFYLFRYLKSFSL